MQQNIENSEPAGVPAGRHEVTSLNVDNLDVQELERRLELVAAAPDVQCWILGEF